MLFSEHFIELSLLGLLLLILLSAFFSASEIGMMSLNRYRLRHLVRQGHSGAKRAETLLKRPDRLLGVILIGNTFANILASSLATTLASGWFDQLGVLIVTLFLTLVILIFAEIMPKTVAALYPERMAFATALPLRFLLWLFYPLVWLTNVIANAGLRLFGVKLDKVKSEKVSIDELRTIVHESSGHISEQHQEMLLRILNLEHVTVEDVMSSRSEIEGIDLNAPMSTIIANIVQSKHNRLPVYYRHIDDLKGILHIREAIQSIASNKFSKRSLLRLLKPAYFIPETTPLHLQLLQFEKERQRSALVVDEYGDIQGLVTLEDILAEIVGEFTSERFTTAAEIHPQSDGSALVAGETNLREINRVMEWDLPTDGPKTLNGLIVEQLETMPTVGVWVHIEGYPIEVLAMKDNIVKLARILPSQKPEKDELIQ